MHSRQHADCADGDNIPTHTVLSLIIDGKFTIIPTLDLLDLSINSRPGLQNQMKYPRNH